MVEERAGAERAGQGDVHQHAQRQRAGRRARHHGRDALAEARYRAAGRALLAGQAPDGCQTVGDLVEVLEDGLQAERRDARGARERDEIGTGGMRHQQQIRTAPEQGLAVVDHADVHPGERVGDVAVAGVVGNRADRRYPRRGHDGEQEVIRHQRLRGDPGRRPGQPDGVADP